MGPVSEAREVVLLGSTGSIGTQAIDIVRRNPDRFRVVALGAGGGNVELLAAQALELGVEAVGVAKATAAQDLQLAFYAEAQPSAGTPPATSGSRRSSPARTAMTELAAVARATWCSTAWSGSLGLAPTLAALRAGRTLALANKESLVAGGPLVRAAVQRPGQIVPVDSEHSALAQCLRGGPRARGAPADPHRERRRRSAAGGATSWPSVTAGAGARPPDLGHGPGRHDQLGHHGEQGRSR